MGQQWVRLLDQENQTCHAVVENLASSAQTGCGQVCGCDISVISA